MTRSLRRASPALAVAALLLCLPAIAIAAWNAAGSGSGSGKARTLAAGNAPSATASGRSVSVSWNATGGNVPVAGYVVKRYATSGAEQSIGSACNGTVTTTNCTENAVPAGTWRYSVTPRRQNWRGAESPLSAPVTVDGPALSMNPATVTSLPASLSGQITGYLPGQTVTFRLDNATNGQVLTGTITPNPTPANGTSSVSVTLPAGTANGPHTVFAIGSAGDVASADVAVTAQAKTTIETSAYALADSSANNNTQDESLETAFSGDSRTHATGNWGIAFTAARYVQFDLNSPARPGQNLGSAALDLRFATGFFFAQGCFYVEVRRASTNAVVGTQGSAANPYCMTGSTQTDFSVPLTSVDTVALANDLRVRVYGRTSLPTNWTIDRATVALSLEDGSGNLFANSMVDASTGTAQTIPWSLWANDASLFASGSNWPNDYSSSRYVEIAFPAYVPGDATIESVVLSHSYRSSRAGREVCNWVQTLSGGTPIGSHPAPGADLSCNSSATSDVTDTVALPEVDTVAEANALSARFFFQRNGGGTGSEQNRARLTITYTK